MVSTIVKSTIKRLALTPSKIRKIDFNSDIKESIENSVQSYLESFIPNIAAELAKDGLWEKRLATRKIKELTIFKWVFTSLAFTFFAIGLFTLIFKVPQESLNPIPFLFMTIPIVLILVIYNTAIKEQKAISQHLNISQSISANSTPSMKELKEIYFQEIEQKSKRDQLNVDIVKGVFEKIIDDFANKKK